MNAPEPRLDYAAFLDLKTQLGSFDGFEPVFMPDFLFDFQKALVDWAVRKGKAAIFADCGLGKTPMQLVWAENVVRKTNRPVLILTPLAVSHQTVAEAAKFGIEGTRTIPHGKASGIVVTNYERLHHFNPSDFAGCVCDESSILKSDDGTRRGEINNSLFLKTTVPTGTLIIKSAPLLPYLSLLPPGKPFSAT